MFKPSIYPTIRSIDRSSKQASKPSWEHSQSISCDRLFSFYLNVLRLFENRKHKNREMCVEERKISWSNELSINLNMFICKLYRLSNNAQSKEKEVEDEK